MTKPIGASGKRPRSAPLPAADDPTRELPPEGHWTPENPKPGHGVGQLRTVDDIDRTEQGIQRMNEAEEWPGYPVEGDPDGHSLNLPLGLAAWLAVKRLVWPDRSDDQKVKAHVLSLNAFPWGRTVHIRLEPGNTGRGEPTAIKVFVEDKSGTHLVYEGHRNDENDNRKVK